MRWSVVLFVFVFFEVYAFQAVRTLSNSTLIQVLYISISVLIQGYVFFVFANYDRSVGPTQDTLRAGGLFLLGFVPKLVLVVFMFGEDVIRTGVWAYNYITAAFSEASEVSYLPPRRAFISKLAWSVAAIPFAGLLHGIFRGKYNFKVLTHVLYFEDLPTSFDGMRITQISDIHSGSFNDRKKIEYAIDLINAQKGDLLLFTGDIVNTTADEMDPWIDLFNRLEAPKYGKYSILGNHDYGEYVTWASEQAKQDNFRAIKDIHAAIGFRLLCNQSVYITQDEERLALLGVENWGHNFKKAGDLQLAARDIAANDFKILMSHDPSHWEHEVKKDSYHYHLTLSGHTHGFQFGIEIPGFLKWSPVQYVYKQWAGMYEFAGQYLNVNRGFGFHAFPGRVGIWPEITVIELRKKRGVVS